MKELIGWDQRVSEAHREPLELPMPEGEPIRITQPKGGTIRKINRAQKAGDQDAAVTALFGEASGRRLLDLYEDAPAAVLPDLVGEILEEFGLAAVGDTAASSN